MLPTVELLNSTQLQMNSIRNVCTVLLYLLLLLLILLQQELVTHLEETLVPKPVIMPLKLVTQDLIQENWKVLNRIALDLAAHDPSVPKP